MSSPLDKPSKEGPRWKSVMEFSILILLYLTLNSTLNIMNRWALGIYGFTFPILLTICHMMFAFVVLLPVMVANTKLQHRATLKRQYKGLMCIGVFMALNVSLNNLSLVQISLSLNQVIRAAMPVVTAAVAVFVERKVPSKTEATALLMLVSGVIISVFEGQASGSSYGITLSITGVLCAAAMMSTAGKVLSEKIDVLQLAFYTAPVSSCVLLPFFWILEKDKFLVYAQENGAAVAFIVLLGSTVALAYNAVHNMLLKRTSSVAVTVLGEVKIVGLLILSAIILPGESSQFTAKMTVGCVLAMLGFCLYSNTKLVMARRAAAGQGQPAKQAKQGVDMEEGQALMQEVPVSGYEKYDAVSKSMDRGSAKIRASDGSARVVHDVHAVAGHTHSAPPAR